MKMSFLVKNFMQYKVYIHPGPYQKQFDKNSKKIHFSESWHLHNLINKF